MSLVIQESRQGFSFVENYIHNIPWEQHPVFPAGVSEEYIPAFKIAFGDISESSLGINFDDDSWDFNSYFPYKNSQSLVVNFSRLPEDIKLVCKFFTFNAIRTKVKVSTISKRITDLSVVLTELKSKNVYTLFQCLTAEEVIQHIENKDVTPGHKTNLYTAVEQIYTFIENYYPQHKFLLDVSEVQKKSVLARKAAVEGNYKTPNIPDEYLEKIINTASRVMRDTSADINMRETAAILIILSQTGLRVGDLLALKETDLKDICLKKSGLKVHFINYIASKNSKPHQKPRTFNIVSNDLCSEAFNILVGLKNSHYASIKDNPFICILTWNLKDGSFKKPKLPMQQVQFDRYMQKFFYTYLRTESQQKWDGITPAKYRCSRKELYLNIPNPIQFRVAVCTYFYKCNIPLTYIMKYMGHLSESMMGYYVRPSDKSGEEANYEERILYEMIKEDAVPLGHLGEELRERALDWLEENKVTVNSDIKEISESIGDKILIVSKLGGVCTCIRNSFFTCAEDLSTDDLLCAYGDCKNIYTFYFNADLTYLDFVTAVESYQNLVKKGHERYAQKELVKVKDICRRRLQPQMESLNSMISKKGEEYILKRFPSLADVIAKKDQIKQEIDIWMNKKS